MAHPASYFQSSSIALAVALALAAVPSAQAGDILRGGISAAPANAPAATSGSITAQANKATANAADALARTTAALQSVQAMQISARKAALAAAPKLKPNLPNVPNGLGVNGLQVAPGVPINLSAPTASENPALWTGAKLPTQTVSGGKTKVTIVQTQSQALLNWKTFNIGKQTRVTFDQKAGGKDASKWIAFNQITDPNGNPTQILGSLDAIGQVYLINTNGIIFGGSSQVNTRTLAASSLPINTNLIQRGLLNNPDSQFLFSALALPSGSKGPTPAFDPGTFPNGKVGDVIVQSGATLSSPISGDGNGGRVLLVGARVTNAGTISTPAGQTILASGLQVGIAAHASSDPSLRGLDVFVGNTGTDAGVTTNTGLIAAERGSTILTGKTVNQLGGIMSTTTVGLNGRIDLLANYNAVSNTNFDPVTRPNSPQFLFKDSGVVNLGAASVTQILPDFASPETLASTTLPLRSQLNFQGKTIYLGKNATVLAPNAKISLRAGLWDFRDLGQGLQVSDFIFSTATAPAILPQIFLDLGATINVAGSTGISIPVEQNILSVDVRGAQVADSPLQRTGVVRGSTLHLDLRIHGPWDPTANDGAGDYSWVGSPLVDARGFRDLIQRSVGELTVGGGTVELTAGSSVILQRSSSINVSGGSISYEGGTIQTTRLLRDGQLVDISQATPDRVYDSFYTGDYTRTFSKYGLSETFQHALALTGSHYEPGYVQGAGGGSIAIKAPALALDGELLGNTISGQKQREEAPAPSSLSLSFQQQDRDSQHYDFSPTPPQIVFQETAPLAPVPEFSMDDLGNALSISLARQQKVFLSPELLTTGGFGKLTIENSDGEIIVPSGVSLEARPGNGSSQSVISLTAANITIDGHITAPGGALSFTVYDTTPFRSHYFPPTNTIPPDPFVDLTRGNFRLGSTGILNTAGLIVDDRLTPDSDSPLVIAGGSITVNAFSANLEAGSVFDVSGGVGFNSRGQLTYGKGGAISIKAGQDPRVPALTGGLLSLGSEFKGYSGSLGGSLSLQAPIIQIGGTAPETTNIQVDGKLVSQLDFGTVLVDPKAFVLLSPEFFSTGGFANFALTGIGLPGGAVDAYLPAISIEPGTVIQPRVTSLLASYQLDNNGSLIISQVLLPQAQRQAVGLSFTAKGATDFGGKLAIRGDFVLGRNALIQTDPFSDGTRGVTISAQTADILGSIIAPAGSISISSGTNSGNLFSIAGADRAVATLHLGNQSLLSAAGASAIYLDGFGLRTGSVFDGGTVNLAGNIVAESGSRIDVSGTNATLDLLPQFSGQTTALSSPGLRVPGGSTLGQQRQATIVSSNAGSISLQGGELLYSDATLLGTTGGSQSLGGGLTISSSIYLPPATFQTPLDVTLNVQQSGDVFPASYHTTTPVIGRSVVDLAGAASGGGHTAVDSFANGGFDAINLRGTVAFRGPVNIAAGRELRIADGGVLFADSHVRLSAPYVALGLDFVTPQTTAQQQQILSIFTSNGPFFFGPTFGSGHLTVDASLIDIGSLSLQGIGRADFHADGGAVRGNGILDVSGDVSFRAAQVYPTTASSFLVLAYEKNIEVISSSTSTKHVTMASTALPPGFGVGSPLLGSTVVSIDGTDVTLQSNANKTITSKTPLVFAPGSGSVRIVRSGNLSLPLSAGGTLSIYASNIQQGGAIFAPGGTINLGWNGTGTPPKDLISGAGLTGAGSLKLTTIPLTQTLTLLSHSITSVSLVDPQTGQGALIPYGLNLNGSQYIDPTGTDITAGGLPGKTVNLSAVSMADRRGSIIDLRGGGDLYAYRFNAGVGGSKDILSSNRVFAILPDADLHFAPYAPFNADPQTDNLGGDPGYVSRLRAGEKITLQGGGGIPAGTYTLLPARYALLPGAYLITPQLDSPVGSYALPEGSSIVSGYRAGQSLYHRFEVASSEVVRNRAEYQDFFANSFLKQGALTNNAQVPRLPGDAGHLVFNALTALTLQGNVLGQGIGGQYGAAIDISSPANILISGRQKVSGFAGLVLDSDELSSFHAESLLIGGIRTFGPDDETVTANTGNLTVDNSGTSLRGADIILVAKTNITLAPGSSILQSRSAQRADSLVLGNDAQIGSGDGVLVRVNGDPRAAIRRLGLSVAQAGQPTLTVGAGTTLAGASITLDSTYGFELSPDARLRGDTISLSAGQVLLQLDESATPNIAGLEIAGSVLRNLERAESLSLLSYGAFDIYGSGTFSLDGNLSIHAPEIRGFQASSGLATINAASIILDNSTGRTGPGPIAAYNPAQGGALAGALQFTTQDLTLGAGNLFIDQFASLDLSASKRIYLGNTGSLHTAGLITGTTPLLTSAQGSIYSIISGGTLTFTKLAGDSSASANNLGATLTLQGTSVTISSDIVLHSGSLSLLATGTTSGDGVFVNGDLDVSGVARSFFDLTKYTNGGDITISSQSGNVELASQSLLDVSAAPGGGDAGSVAIITPKGDLLLGGKFLGKQGVGGLGGTFSLDVSSLQNTTELASVLDTGGFSFSRSFRVRNGDVTLDSLIRTLHYALSADAGSITVASGGFIDASGQTGGSIRLVASQNVVLQDGSILSVEGNTFSHAGKGGDISLEAGSGVLVNNTYLSSATGTVDIQSGSTLNLGVKDTYDSQGNVDTGKLNAAAALGKFTGTLHLRAPQTTSGLDLNVTPIAGNLLGTPSSIVIEGFRIYQPSGGQIDNVESNISADAITFAGNSTFIRQRLFGSSAPFAAVITPGAEIINATGDLTLSNDWDLSSFRFGPRNAAGVLTMRAAGNLIFNGALSDGFDVNLIPDLPFLYVAPMMAANNLLPTNNQSWSYNLSAGADFSATDFHRVRALGNLSASTGSLQLGQPYNHLSASPDNITLLALLEQNVYQVIRTGSGSIDIAVGRDVQLRNPFATIYTAGTQVEDPTKVVSANDFEVPIPQAVDQGALGADQFPTWAPQYSLAGGDVSISAQQDIRHQTATGDADSERQLPTSWLYRRSYVSADGTWGRSPFGEIASTTWWVDFSNFFEGIGTLGGGDVSLNAGRNVENIDAVVATNSRTQGKNASGPIAAATASTIELGGGDLSVITGGDISAGVYYIERGQGRLQAGGSIHTNSTRAPSSAVVTGGTITSPEATWLPTTLFLGKGGFQVSAKGDVLLGPVVNPFLTPAGLSNNYLYRTYFSTYSEDSSVEIVSLGGNIDLREMAYAGFVQPILQAWMKEVSLLQPGSSGATAAYYEPWIRINETSVLPFSTALSLLPGTLRATSFTGDINLQGNITLAPARRGTLELAATGSLNGLQIVGANAFFKLSTSSQLLVSDADPAALPGLFSPLADQAFPSLAGSPRESTKPAIFIGLDALFAESGSTIGNKAALQNKLNLHDTSILHLGDAEPVRLYASSGNVADLTLYSPKAARVLASDDITNIGLYIQNTALEDVSTVAAGRDIVAYNPNSPALLAAQQSGFSTFAAFNGQNPAQSGDIQISGPGTLEVLAGRNLTLGVGRNLNLASDLGIGITSIGNTRNPGLDFDGARLILGAGIGGPADLAGSDLDFKSFIADVVTQANLDLYQTELSASHPAFTGRNLADLSPEEQASIALDIFYRILRDAGHDHNDPASPDFGTYAKGMAAIQSLFPDSYVGEIDLSSRSVKTNQGGDINLFAPGGGLALGSNIPGPNEVPPGIVTESGGSISIFTDQSVQVGALRIFTLRGGDEIIWSTSGDIAAGNASKTVKTAPPTRVLIDAQTASVETDLAGLATGGGIGVLASVAGVPPGNVDLIAPSGTVDAGDAGIRASGNLNISAVQVLNADNIQVSGTSVGVPTVVAPTVSLSGLTAANTSSAAGSQAAGDVAKKNQEATQQGELPSIISVEVLGYGG